MPLTFRHPDKLTRQIIYLNYTQTNDRSSMGLLELFIKGKYERDVSRMLMRRRAYLLAKSLLHRYSFVLYIIVLSIKNKGLIWLFVLPLSELHKKAESDERAILIGQVAKHFSPHEEVYRSTFEGLLDQDASHTQFIDTQFQLLGFETTVQNYSSTIDDNTVFAQNVHGILRTPRAEGTECIIISAPFKTSDGSINKNGIILLFNIARFFKSNCD
jgi:GPI-anchor transamidase subunit GAA1